jgi:hypothetical protein
MRSLVALALATLTLSAPAHARGLELLKTVDLAIGYGTSDYQLSVVPAQSLTGIYLTVARDAGCPAAPQMSVDAGEAGSGAWTPLHQDADGVYRLAGGRAALVDAVHLTIDQRRYDEIVCNVEVSAETAGGGNGGTGACQMICDEGFTACAEGPADQCDAAGISALFASQGKLFPRCLGRIAFSPGGLCR